MTTDSRDIPLEKEIDAYIKGALSQPEVEKLWIELLKKPEYISLLQTEIDVSKIYRARQEQKRNKTTYWPWVATAAVVIGLIVSLNFFRNNSQKTVEEWAKSKINVVENLATAQVTRSASSIEPIDSLLNAGFKAVINGNPKMAIKIYENILKQYKDPQTLSKAHLNLGILFYNTGSFTECIQHFKQSVTNPDDETLQKERAYWYMGNAYINLKQLPEARGAIKNALSIGQLYKGEEFKLLKRLNYTLGNVDFNDSEQK